MSNPVAVLLSDVHYSVQTLKVADNATRQAVSKANDLRVPLIVAGDLHDTKANLRGECVNAMIETFKLCNQPPYILIGNHDRLNEKAPAHSLNFLRELSWSETIDPYSIDTSETKEYLQLIDKPTFTNEIAVNRMSLHLVPYNHDLGDLRSYLKTVDKGSTIIMHQGLEGSDSGDYIQDRSALIYDDVKDFRVISGHYHRRQDIKTGRPRKGAVGLFSYIGNPYTLGFGEAEHPPKGFQILMDDGTLEFVPTNLRKHVIWNETVGEQRNCASFESNDLILMKIRGTREQLANFKYPIPLCASFRVDLIPTDDITVPSTTKLEADQLMDSLIDSLDGASEARKERLKILWKCLCE